MVKIQKVIHLYPKAETKLIDGVYKPELTPLTDLPPEHEKQMRFTRLQKEMLFISKRIPMLMPDQVLLALEMNYDIFNLIKTGQAINKNA